MWGAKEKHAMDMTQDIRVFRFLVGSDKSLEYVSSYFNGDVVSISSQSTDLLEDDSP